VYGGSGVIDSGGKDGDGVDGGEWCNERADPILDSLSDSYSLLDSISVDVSGPSSCPTSHHLLTTALIKL